MFNLKFFSQPFAKLLVTCRSWSAKRLFEINDNFRIIVRNHWSGWFNDSFLFVIDKKPQGQEVDVYRIGLFNICLCLIYDKSPVK